MTTGVIKYHWMPSKYHRSRTMSVASIVLHSTDGSKSGDLQTLQTGDGRQISVHWYVTKAGEYYHFVQDGDVANHAGTTIAARYSNARSIGIEQEHIDGKETWPDALIQATVNLCAFLRQQYPGIEITSHAHAASPPGRKVDPEGYPWDKFNAMLEHAVTIHWGSAPI